ncbi:MAG: UDP-N-acetylmuramoyl-L-alanyl-D-glutamate--2,6-diaminopimelate ligase [Erysipelotrichaceae bacterium]|nr:UDP-N-acetylmuramoyl-L-alanyl-D-glutamate--2,6-diaminopimelate ligase [Erysipelotrichaceae bacterium]
MKVNKLCRRLGLPLAIFNHDIFQITDDSRSCIENSIFFAISGSRIDGHDLIDKAIDNGAATIFLEHKVKERLGVNYIYCHSTKRYLAIALKEYHKYATKRLKIIGVIGTNGKTTTSTLIYNYLQFINLNSMLIGSNGCYAKDFYHQHENTTPKATELYSYFEYARNHKIKYIVMEISSIAVSELRVLGIDFNTIIYTNFSEDHLDYHKTMDRYLFAKLIPFYKLQENKNVIVNLDDKFSEYVIKHSTANIIGYSIRNESKYKVSNLIHNEYGMEMDINNIHVRSNLLGRFNAYNILPLFSLCEALSISSTCIPEFLNQFKQVDGRMNVFELNGRNVIIDYAHTEEAIKSVIKVVKELAKGDIYIVLGCGGNREREKRTKIGKLLDNEKCINIITSDNSRFENPEDIINEILLGFSQRPIVIIDRKEAIMYALNKSKENDYILILGKGVENYLDINGKKEPYSDLDVINEYRG